ncbi:MAG: hypothetical protein AB1427_02955 [Thermodesulfobacteriota bacterium]
MSMDVFYNLLEKLESLGIALSIAAWLTVLLGSLGLILLLRRERSSSSRIWRSASIIGVMALAANLTDYFVTFHRSPDLYLEVNPIWRNVIDTWGITVAWWYGFSGKILLSLVAGLMAAVYLTRRDRLYPERAASFFDFMRRMGERSRSWRDRLSNLFTVFCFFFAGIQLFCFYIAFLNWRVDFETDPRVPPVLPALVLTLLVIGAAFLILTSRAFQKHIARGRTP